MKVCNLTDVPTAALQLQHLVNVSIRVKDVVIGPGAVHEFPARYRRFVLNAHLNCGALHIGEPPAEYLAKKPVKEEPATPTEPRRRVLEVPLPEPTVQDLVDVAEELEDEDG